MCVCACGCVCACVCACACESHQPRHTDIWLQASIKKRRGRKEKGLKTIKLGRLCSPVLKSVQQVTDVPDYARSFKNTLNYHELNVIVSKILLNINKHPTTYTHLQTSI